MARQLTIRKVKIKDEEELALVKKLSAQFAKNVDQFENGNWELEMYKEAGPLYGKLKSYYLKFPNSKNREYKRQGIHSFIKSVAIRSGVFLIAESDLKGDKKRKPKPYYGSPEKTREHYEKNAPLKCSEVLIVTNFNTMIREVAETLTKGTTVKVINNSPKKELISRIRKASKKKLPPNTTDATEEETYKYYERLNRKGQAKFRNDLLEKYNSTCVITKCEVESALEAAHIIPFADSKDDDPKNGLLLRADLHRLFDTGFMAIDPKTCKVHFKNKNKHYEHYNDYDQKEIDIPEDSCEKLTTRWEKFNEQIEINTTIVSRETKDKESE